MIEFTINNRTVIANKGETILDVARREDFYIPTMCYLTKVTPISSCRLCVVEVEDTDGLILSCQTPAKKGINVTTDSPKLFKERQKIMEFYGVNHPLQCGVCDKSGECDLQNKTTEFKVNEQHFGAKDQKRDIEDWGNVQYDPSLCIMCERCVSVSSEIVGDNNLKISYGGYSSKIKRKDNSKSISGECMAVCPVGALASKDFKYISNSWELDKIPSVCSHCSIGCSINYEVKQDKIYRVTNDYNFASLCDVGRFNFDFANNSKKDKKQFALAIEEFKRADSINFTSKITNEEALILEQLREKLGIKLVNSDALNYQNFLYNYSLTSKKSLYNGTIEDIKKSDYIIVFGSQVSNDLPVVKYAINQAVKTNGAEVIYLNPMEDPTLNCIITNYIKYEVGAEEGVASLLAEAFIDKESLNDSENKFFKDLDIGYIASESNVGEEEIEEIVENLIRKTNPIIIVGKELYSHPQSSNIGKILGLFESKSKFKVILAPSELNTLGVSKICTLDKDVGDYTIGYKASGNFVLTDSKELDEKSLAVPSLISQEGTIVNLDKCVAPLHSGIDFNGYTLADIALEFGINIKYTTDLTKELPIKTGFKPVSFDSLEDYYDNDGTLHRGYDLIAQDIDSSYSFDDISDISEFNGSVIRFIDFALDRTSKEQNGVMLFVSQQFLNAFKVADNESVKFNIKGLELIGTIKLDVKLKGTVGLVTVATLNNYDKSSTEGYPYVQIKLEKVGQ